MLTTTPSYPMRIEMGAKTSDPKVSVVMPNFNKGEFLAGAIESVLSQSMTSFELLIVDDASTDASSEIAGRYAERDSRITLIRNATRKGVSAARNTGIRLSRGPVIGFIDSDDLYAPTKLDRQLRVLEQSESPVVSYCDYWQVDEKGNELPPSRYPVYKESGSIFGDVLAGKFGIKTTILLPRECLQEVGPFDESLIFSEDLDMILRLSLRYPFIWLDEKLYSYRVFPGNTRNKISEFTFNSTRALVVEKYWKSSGAVLTSDQRRIVILNLTKHFRKSSQTGKMVSYGLKSAASFKYMVSEPFRRHGLRRLLRPLGSANSS